MLDVELWRIVSEKVQERKRDIMSHMEHGKYQDIIKYREDVGFLYGLKFVEDAVRDIYKPKESEDD